MAVTTLENKKKPNWLLIGCGCFIISIILIVSIFLLIGHAIFSGIKNSEPYKMSVALVENTPDLKSELGNIKSYGYWGYFVAGNISISGSGGTANFKIPVNSEKNAGILETNLIKENGLWKITSAYYYAPKEGFSYTFNFDEKEIPIEPSENTYVVPTPTVVAPTEAERPNPPINNTGKSLYKKATICKSFLEDDYSPVNPTNTFTSNAPSFYCTFEVEDIPPDSLAEGVWIAENIVGYDKNYEIDTSRVTLQPYWVGYFALDKGDNPWPKGTYRVDMYLNGKFQESHKFSVK